MFACSINASARLWTDTSGKQIEAEILDKAETSLTIRPADGQIFTFPIARLIEADRQFISAWSPAVLPVPAVEEALVLIETPTGKGSGFIAQIGGRVYIVTNQHVIAGAGAREISIRTLKNETITIDRLEVSASLDLARFPIAPRPALTFGFDVALDTSITAYGNSQGAGVATVGRGRVLGLAADRFEFDAEVVPGNSGGPVLGGTGRVVGVASYVQSLARTDDWTTAGTRYEKTRRFALRPLAVTDWTPVEWGVYGAQMQRLNAARDVVDQAWAVAASMLRNPGQSLDRDSSLVMGVKDIVQRQNDHARRIQNRVGESIRSRSEIDRANESLNAIERDNLKPGPNIRQSGLTSPRARHRGSEPMSPPAGRANEAIDNRCQGAAIGFPIDRAT